MREIELREGLWLTIESGHLFDRMHLAIPEREHSLEFTIFVSGERDSNLLTLENGKYVLCGSGMAPKDTSIWMDDKPLQLISVHLTPELFCSFVGDRFGQLPNELKTLIREPHQPYYMHSGSTTIAMQIAVQQILRCPHHDIIQRIYLESKVYELLSLVLKPLTESQDVQHPSQILKQDDRDRIHHARTILLRHLDNLLSIADLAQQVGLNTCTLKYGFRQEFGKPVISYLREHRLEQARQLLDLGEMNVSEVARTVGYIDRKGFAKAFYKQFGLNPRDYLKRQKNSR